MSRSTILFEDSSPPDVLEAQVPVAGRPPVLRHEEHLDVLMAKALVMAQLLATDEALRLDVQKRLV